MTKTQDRAMFVSILAREFPLLSAFQVADLARQLCRLSATLQRLAEAVFIVSINIDNDAFTPDPGVEVARILRVIADQVAREGLPAGVGSARDVNGNSVGRYSRKG